MTEYEKEELGKDIADQGRWEEFHQRKGNTALYEHYKERRLELQKKYNKAMDSAPLQTREGS